MIADIATLEDRLSEPTPQAVAALGRSSGPLVILGAGGKMGPTLARMAKRAAPHRRVIAVSRFSDSVAAEQLRQHGVEIIQADLLDADQVARLPDATDVLSTLGLKFGTAGQAALTWAVNAYVPSLICRRYRTARIVAFSTGNVYGMTPVVTGGSLESDPPRPDGEYAMTALARERMYEHFSRTLDLPMVLLRLNYACEMRYGVLADVARTVWAGEPVGVSTGAFNAIWQGDANAMALAAFDVCDTPPRILNLAGPETLSVRRLAIRFGELLGKPATVTGSESADAYLSNAQESHRLFGYPRVPVAEMMEWLADWIRRDGPTLGKPTHFEVRDGQF